MNDPSVTTEEEQLVLKKKKEKKKKMISLSRENIHIMQMMSADVWKPQTAGLDLCPHGLDGFFHSDELSISPPRFLSHFSPLTHFPLNVFPSDLKR